MRGGLGSKPEGFSNSVLDWFPFSGSGEETFHDWEGWEEVGGSTGCEGTGSFTEGKEIED